ncbi:hypothetical protein Tcan_14502 [Toxocara canis]|uniref:G protein-coupled receptor n=1 Tax=Toxocara canis TaxID=6265 RepID=A0A0B2V8C0_TOXCA|nr:hypothetical protein Tcan_14502 [Toxocara canis]
MSVLGTVLTINTHFTSALSVLPNLLVIYLALTTGINEIPEYRFIIIVQAFNEILNSVTLSIIDMDAMSLPGVDYKMFTSAISAIVLAVLVFGGYTIVFITSKRIFATLNGVRIVEKTRRLQKQLAIIMLLQAILPLIFIILPLAILFSLIYAQVTIGPYASFASIAYNWQPCAQPYITLYFLSPFRKRIRKMLPFGWVGKAAKNITVVTNVNQYSSHSEMQERRSMNGKAT